MGRDDGGEILDRTSYVTAPSGRKLAIGGLGVGDFMSIRNAALEYHVAKMVGLVVASAGNVSEAEKRSVRMDAVERYSELEHSELPTKKLKGKSVDYSIWWVSSTPEGMIFALWLMTKNVNDGVSLEDIRDLFSVENEDGTQSLDEKTLEQAADDGGRLVSTLSKNGEPPERGQKNKKGRKKRKRRSAG